MSQNKTAGGKGTLANDTSAFRRTLVWCGVALAIHVVIIGGVSGMQWALKTSEADKAAVKDSASANAANAAPANAAAASGASESLRNNTSRNTPSDDWLNPSGSNAAANRPSGNSAVERRITESDSSLPGMSGMDID